MGHLAFLWGLCYHVPTCGRLAQLVRASRLHREGQRFESFSVYHQNTLLRGSVLRKGGVKTWRAARAP